MTPKLVFVLIFLSAFSVGFVRGKVKEGNKFFREEKYGEALTKYTSAQIQRPASPELYFNIADVLYKQHKYNEAGQLLTKALSEADKELKAKIYYNMGNTKYRQGQLQSSIDYYKKALELAPDDEDTKYNIEFVERKLKGLEKQEGEREEEGEGEETKTETQQKKEEYPVRLRRPPLLQKGEGEENPSSEERGASREGKEEKTVSETSQEIHEAGKQETQEEMTKEEAETLLRMMAEEERGYKKPEGEERLKRGGWPGAEKPW